MSHGAPPSLQELRAASDDRDAAIVSVNDLKKLFIGLFMAAVTAAFGLGSYFNSKLIANGDADAKRDVQIQALKDSFDHSTETGRRLERSIEDQQKIGSQMLIEMTKLAGKVASTEEISRNTQARVEALTDYLRQTTRDTKKEVLSKEDSVYSPRGINR